MTAQSEAPGVLARAEPRATAVVFAVVADAAGQEECRWETALRLWAAPAAAEGLTHKER